MITIDNIKNIFINFFIKKNHTLINSSPLIIKNSDLLFTNSGMNQFKDIFLGIKKTKYKKIITIQKCLRLGGKHNDLNLIGYSNKHHTLFEMMGNFSFNDYWKDLAIEYAWDLLTNNKYYNLSKDKILVTLHNNDSESYHIWKDIIKIPINRIIKTGLDKCNNTINDLKCSNNFWQMGNIGPCGLSTEIFFDKYNLLSNDYNHNKMNILNNKFIELWNIVFIEFFLKHNDQLLYNLKDKFIDTGIGLERLIYVINNLKSTYKISFFKKNIKYLKLKIKKNSIFKKKYNSLYIIVDHIRTIFFLILDGLRPSNNKHGYILKKLIRRVIFHQYYYLKIKEHILSKLILNLLNEYNINKKIELIINIITNEENKFLKILLIGKKYINKFLIIKNMKKKLYYKKAYKLYDTIGLPLDFIKEICFKKNIYLNLFKLNKYIKKYKLINKNYNK